MKLVAKFAAGVVDTGGKSAAGVVDTGGNLAIGVIDTGCKYATGVVDTGLVYLDLRISPQTFEKILIDPSVIFRGLGECDS